MIELSANYSLFLVFCMLTGMLIKVIEEKSANETCEGCPVFEDGLRSERMCGHLDCWNEWSENGK